MLFHIFTSLFQLPVRLSICEYAFTSISRIRWMMITWVYSSSSVVVVVFAVLDCCMYHHHWAVLFSQFIHSFSLFQFNSSIWFEIIDWKIVLRVFLFLSSTFNISSVWMNEMILLWLRTHMLTHLIMLIIEKEKESWSNYAKSSIGLVGGNGLAKTACLFIRFEFFVL